MNSIDFSTAVTMMPPVGHISKDIVLQNDLNSDSALSIEELGVEEDVFASLDADGDGLVTQNEIATAINSQLSQFDGEMPTGEEFASMLSSMGLEMPEPPEHKEMDSSTFVSELISNYDTDGDGLLSADEVSILNDEEFAALDTDSDGSISAEELTTAVDTVAQSGGTPPSSGGVASSSSEEETFDEMDTNEDGVVSQAEIKAYNASMGIETSSEVDEVTQNALDNIKLLFETLDINSEDEEKPDISSFKNIMTMLNNQNNNSDLNTYLENLTSSNSSLSSSYA